MAPDAPAPDNKTITFFAALSQLPLMSVLAITVPSFLKGILQAERLDQAKGAHFKTAGKTMSRAVSLLYLFAVKGVAQRILLGLLKVGP